MTEKNAFEGIILERIKGFYDVLSNGERFSCKIKGSLFENSKYNNQASVGDKVEFIKNDSEDNGLIISIKERESILCRSRVDKSVRQVLASNVDQLFIVAALKKPHLKLNFIFRMILAAILGDIKPIVLLSKTDLVDAAEIKEVKDMFQAIDVQTISYSSKSFEEFAPIIQDQLTGKITAIVGQSGVGKSTLLNCLYPELTLKTANVSGKTSRGSHTTTSAKMMELPNNTFLVDTPGVKEFKLWGIDADNLKDYFPLISDFGHSCKLRRCSHIHEPKCEVLRQLETGEIPASIYEQYQQIYHSY